MFLWLKAMIAKARELLAMAPGEKEPDGDQTAKPAMPDVLPCPCPRCGGRMIVIEIVARGCAPNYPSPLSDKPAPKWPHRPKICQQAAMRTRPDPNSFISIDAVRSRPVQPKGIVPQSTTYGCYNCESEKSAGLIGRSGSCDAYETSSAIWQRA